MCHCLREIGTFQISPRKASSNHHRTVQIGILEVGSLKVGANQDCSVECMVREIGSRKIDPTGVQPGCLTTGGGNPALVRAYLGLQVRCDRHFVLS